MDRDPDAIAENHRAESERLIVASDALDEHIDANADLQGVLQVVQRLRRQQRLMLFGGFLLAALVLILSFVIIKVESNADAITRARESRVLFCEQTNRNNLKAHDDFLTQFALNPATRPQFEQFANVAWPQRDCSLIDSP